MLFFVMAYMQYKTLTLGSKLHAMECCQHHWKLAKCA